MFMNQYSHVCHTKSLSILIYSVTNINTEYNIVQYILFTVDLDMLCCAMVVSTP